MPSTVGSYKTSSISFNDPGSINRRSHPQRGRKFPIKENLFKSHGGILTRRAIHFG